MTEAEFNAADRSGTGVPPPAIISDNNPAPKIIKNGAGITKIVSNQGKIYLWDGATALYLQLDKTTGAGSPSEVKYYSLVQCTQVAADFATLLND